MRDQNIAACFGSLTKIVGMIINALQHSRQDILFL